jgi:hypothetical protein
VLVGNWIGFRREADVMSSAKALAHDAGMNRRCQTGRERASR